MQHNRVPGTTAAHHRRRLWHGGLLVGWLALAAPLRGANFTVSPSYVGGVGERNERLANTFVELLALGGRHQAAVAAPARWSELPRRVVATNHINTLWIEFGHRVELLAFMFNETATVVDLVARAPALRNQEGKYYGHDSAPPGDYQLVENVHHDLANNFQMLYAAPPELLGRIQLLFAEPAQELPPEIGEGGALATSGSGAALQAHPLVAAALFAEGWQASSMAEEQAVVVSIEQETLTYALRAATYRQGRLLQVAHHKEIRHERLYDALRLVLRHALEWHEAVTDLVNVGSDKPQLAWVGRLEQPDAEFDFRLATCLVLADRQGHYATEAATGVELWSTRRERKEARSFLQGGEIFELEGDQLRLLCPTSGVARLTLTDFGPHFDATSGGARLALAKGGELRFYEYDKLVQRITMPTKAPGRPTLLAGGAVALTQGRWLRLYNWQGKLLWQRGLTQECDELLLQTDELLLVAGRLGGLAVLNAGGELLWQVELGELLAGWPAIVAEGVLVATKAGRLLLLNRADGTTIRERHTGGWLREVVVVEGVVVALDHGVALTSYSSATLEPLRRLTTPFRLQPGLLACHGLDFGRATFELQQNRTPQLLASDEKGNLLLLSLAALGRSAP